ncbi:MAG: hypothetical protein KDB72_07935 [Mycobacterium sp.]|nr:hypothetical protein [Mycobacterium sp.]
MRTYEEFETVRRLIAAGFNDCEIARRTGVPRGTVQDWRCRPPAKLCSSARTSCGALRRHTTLPVKQYCYLLGLYLGDGCISRMGRVWRLRITLDKKHPGIIDSCRNAIDTVMPGQRASVQPQRQGCVVVSIYSKHWPCLFPQHGPGRKHNRPIVLEPTTALDRLGIPWTRSTKYVVSVYRKSATARPDEFIGPKC